MMPLWHAMHQSMHRWGEHSSRQRCCFDSVKYVGCEGPAMLSSVPSITKKHHLDILSTQLAGKNFVWDIFRAKTELQKHSIGKWSSFKYCTVWSVETIWQSSASVSVNRLIFGGLLCGTLLKWVVIDYLLTFTECVKYTSFASASYLVSKLHWFI